MFHKTIHKAWNFFNLSEQPLEKFCRKFNFRISIDRKVLSINRLLFSIDRTGIDQRSNQAEAPRFFLYHFNQSSQSFDRSKMLNPKFSLYETIFSKLKQHYYNLSLYIPIYTTRATKQPVVWVSNRTAWYSMSKNKTNPSSPQILPQNQATILVLLLSSWIQEI